MRKPRRRIITIAIVSSVIIGLAGLAAYAWMEKRGAETRGRIALLAAQSRSLLESESDLALLLSVEANRLAEDLAGSATLGTGLLKKAASALSNENYAAGAARPDLPLWDKLLQPGDYRAGFESGKGVVYVGSCCWSCCSPRMP